MAGSGSGVSRVAAQLTRLCQLIHALRVARRGVSVRVMMEATGVSRATVYRYLRILETAGFTLEQVTVSGESRRRLIDEAIAVRGLPQPQVAAIALARDALSGLEGTELLGQLDRIVFQRPTPQLAIRARAAGASHAPEIVRVLERAIRDRRRVHLLYRGMKDPEARWREVDAAALQLHPGGELYAWVWPLDRGEWRTFKVARIREAVRLEIPASTHAGLAEVMALPHAVRVWSGEPAEVAIKISPEVATNGHTPSVLRPGDRPHPDGHHVAPPEQ